MAKTVKIIISILFLFVSSTLWADESGKIQNPTITHLATPTYNIPEEPGGKLGGPYTLNADLDLDGKEDSIYLMAAKLGDWFLAVLFSSTEEFVKMQRGKTFSEEMGLSILTPEQFEEWKKSRQPEDRLLKASQGITFSPFAIVLSYGEKSAQAFYWKNDHFESFWIAD